MADWVSYSTVKLQDSRAVKLRTQAAHDQFRQAKQEEAWRAEHPDYEQDVHAQGCLRIVDNETSPVPRGTHLRFTDTEGSEVWSTGQRQTASDGSSDGECALDEEELQQAQEMEKLGLPVRFKCSYRAEIASAATGTLLGTSLNSVHVAL